MKTLKVTVSTTHAFSELAAFALTENGSEGVMIDDPIDIANNLKSGSWDYVDEALYADRPDVVTVSGFFPVDFDASVIKKSLDLLVCGFDGGAGSLKIETDVIDSKEWEDVWKQYYLPIEIGKVTIVPEWLKGSEKKGTLPLYINPGMAFGSGSHETTSMVIELMQELDLENKSVCDVGCGSGILGICSLLLGASECLFIDPDENAVSATKNNLDCNSLKGDAVIRRGSLLESDEKLYDAAFANLTADLLKLLYADLLRCLKKGGSVVVSGIIKGREQEIDELFQKSFKRTAHMSKGEWHAAVYQKV